MSKRDHQKAVAGGLKALGFISATLRLLKPRNTLSRRNDESV
jgi:hypothetical protein